MYIGQNATTKSTVLGSASLLLVAALAGCGGGDTQQPQQPANQPSASATTAPSSGTTGASSATTAPAQGGDVGTARTAIATAEKQGGRAVELDHDKTGEWKIDVVQGDRSTELRVAADGSQITGTGEAEALKGSDKTQVQQAKVALGDALTTATGQVPGTIDEAGLTSHQGKIAYSVEIFGQDDREKSNAYVDAVSGAFLEATKG